MLGTAWSPGPSTIGSSKRPNGRHAVRKQVPLCCLFLLDFASSLPPVVPVLGSGASGLGCGRTRSADRTPSCIAPAAAPLSPVCRSVIWHEEITVYHWKVSLYAHLALKWHWQHTDQVILTGSGSGSCSCSSSDLFLPSCAVLVDLDMTARREGGTSQVGKPAQRRAVLLQTGLEQQHKVIIR